MSKLNVIRASAGSGKTYRITADYLRLLFRYPGNYKHILAVTFTNKATEEMKDRIISELYKLSCGVYSNYSKQLLKEFKLSETELEVKSGLILENILHNYSRFTISTIDSFFQHILKSFAREAGLQHNFDLEFDINNVLEKATDQMLLKLDEDKTLLDWLVQYAGQRIEEGKNWDFKKEIMGLGKELFNEKFTSLDRSFLNKLNDRENLKKFQKQLYTISNAFESHIKENGEKGMLILKLNGLIPSDFKYGTQGGVGQYFLRLASGDIFEPATRITEAAGSIDYWILKGSDKADRVKNAASEGLFELLKNTLVYFKENYRIYKSADEVLGNFFTLGIFSDLSREVSEYTARKNIFLLANSGVFLKAIINENDSPFIYEKTGQSIFHFMIDEFQDTSAIQWHNFVPLIKNCLSENHECMVVGDVKQSIYRWRNSDWKIMARELTKDISDHGINYDNLLFNWRSKSNIVAFNNSFFTGTSTILQQAYNLDFDAFNKTREEVSFLQQIITDAYENCRQKLPSGRKPDEGTVKIQFIENKENDWKEIVLALLPGKIESLQESGQSLKDIAILVRTTSEGSEVANYLNSLSVSDNGEPNFKYQVISNESTFLKNTPVVVFLIKLFTYLTTPEDAINAVSLAYDYNFFFREQNESNKDPLNSKHLSPEVFNPLQSSFESEEKETRLNQNQSNSNYLSSFPEEFISQIKYLKNLPPDELFGNLIRIFKLDKRVSDLPFLQAFHDVIFEFTQSNVASLSVFLEYWEENKNKLSVSVSEDQDAIKVMTIHKSKGLEFKNVIIPFCNWSFDHNWPNTPFIWCPSNNEPFNQLDLLPLRYSAGLKETLFSDGYYIEKAQSYVDNLNLLYVAYTRASDNLLIFSPFPEKKEKLSATNELIYNWVTAQAKLQMDEFPSISVPNHWNAPEKIFDLGNLGRSNNVQNNVTGEMPLQTYPNNEIKEKLRQRYSVPGFWEGIENEEPPVRIYGNLMHRLFQEIITVNDIDKAADTLEILGLIKQSEKKILTEKVTGILSAKPFSDWFSGKWSIRNEAGIFVPGEHLYRPDRVMTQGKETMVIDYKFGKIQSTKYTNQVKKYVEYLKAMGYSKVEGIIWYVNLDLVERV